jgi:hypothetical protein
MCEKKISQLLLLGKHLVADLQRTAEKELSAFYTAILGPEEARRAAYDWIEEMAYQYAGPRRLSSSFRTRLRKEHGVIAVMEGSDDLWVALQIGEHTHSDCDPSQERSHANRRRPWNNGLLHINAGLSPSVLGLVTPRLPRMEREAIR